MPRRRCKCGCGLPVKKDCFYAASHSPSLLTPEQRFWAKVDKASPDECWIWTGYLNTRPGPGHNHGQLKCGGKTVWAHRFSYALANGPIPELTVIRHTCDNPPCVNPAHLIPGTVADNNQDMVARGRWRNWRNMAPTREAIEVPY